jgi:hypothetical protein
MSVRLLLVSDRSRRLKNCGLHNALLLIDDGTVKNTSAIAGFVTFHTRDRKITIVTPIGRSFH